MSAEQGEEDRQLVGCRPQWICLYTVVMESHIRDLESHPKETCHVQLSQSHSFASSDRESRLLKDCSPFTLVFFNSLYSSTL